MKTVLLTGFEPFGDNAVNPSELVAARLDGRLIRGHRVAGAVLACEFGQAIRQLKQRIEQHQPALVVCLGLAQGRGDITPERVALNLDDARIPDNAGRQPTGRPVVRGGPVGYWSTLPVKAIAAALRARGFRASVSQTAGTFVCNHVFYGLMHTLARRRGGARGGFIHLPPVSVGGGANPGWTLDRTTEAVALAIETSLRVRRDLKAVGGTDDPQ
jgi:pyroglutamyl-peptidase